MKHIFSFLLVFALSLGAQAIRPIHRLFAIQNNDGSTVMLYKHGNGHLAYYTTPDNCVVVRNAQGTLCYATLAQDNLVASDVAAHDFDQRSEAEKKYLQTNGLTPSMIPSPAQESAAQAPRRSHTASTADGIGKYGTSGNGAVPSIGEITIPVILVQFSDKKFMTSTTIDKMTRYYNEEGYNEATDGSYYSHGSVRDYFIYQSRGMFKPTFDVVATVTLSKNYAYYGKNNSAGGDSNVWELVQEAVKLAKAQGVDFTKYKSTTGIIPLVSILYAGEGEATCSDENTIWPHECDLGGTTISGYRFGSYFVGNETYNGNIDGHGTFVHEFSHALGLPDFYDTGGSYTNDDAFGMWSVMDTGCYNDNTYNPVGYTAYEKSYLGWLDIPVLKTAQGVLLGDPDDSNSTPAVLIRNPQSTTESIILENRQTGTYAPSNTGPGLMMTRVKYYSQSWDGNTVNNNQNNKRCLMITADGSAIKGYAQTAHLYGNGITDLPTLPLYNGTALNAPVYQIIKHSDRTISISYGERNLYQETAKNGKYYVRVNDLSELASGETVILVNTDEKMAFGQTATTSSRIGTTVCIEGNLAYGNNDLQTLTAKQTTDGKSWGFYYKSSNKNYYLCAGKNGALNTTTSVGNTALASISITNGVAQITFGGSNAKSTIAYTTDNTCFVCGESTDANVAIFRLTDDPTPVNSLQAEQATDNRIYDLSGREITRPTQGIYIRNGKKILVK